MIFERMRHATAEELTAVDGIGDVLADAWIDYFASEKNREAVDGLLAELTIENEAENTEAAIFAGMTFCHHRFGGAFCQSQGITGGH